MWPHSFRPRWGAHSQAVHDGSPLALLALALPLVHLQDQLEEGTLGGGHFSVPRPSQVLELANHQVAFLWLRDRMVDFPSQSQAKNKQNIDELKNKVVLTLVRLQTLKSRLMTSQSIEQDIHSTWTGP